MTFHIITIFPEIFSSYFNESILKRAQDAGKIEIKIYNLRDWAYDKHKTVDDTPYGGGAGMVMKIDVLYKAVSSIKYQVLKEREKNILNTKYLILNTKTILLSAKGKTWNQFLAKEHAVLEDIILICGHYEGVDERITDFIDEEISIGDYVLTGGEIPAMAIIDSITRLIPGVLGNEESPINESFSESGILEHPHYTRPEIFIDDEGIEHSVPDVLLSGDHKKIAEWRKKNNKKKF
jgi:tRNA (guanine37-N1)-methyltransferase